MIRTPEENKQIEKAISFLVNAMNTSGHNPKPVILHSLKIALSLEKQGYSTDIVIGALLHDVVEDSVVTVENIEAEFGSRIAKLVAANTFDKSITDPREQYKELFSKSLAVGKDALRIKADDILDNSEYYKLIDNPDSYNLVLEKMKYFIDLSEPLLKDELVWKELKDKWMILVTP